MAATARLRFRGGPLKRLLSERGGEVMTYTDGRAKRVARRARSLVGVRTGNLKRSIRTEFRPGLKEARVDVVMGDAKAPYAMPYHEGHRAFTLPAKTGGDRPSVYVFTPKGGQEVVFTRGPINIPASSGHPVLEIAARQEGMKLRIHRH